MNKTIKSLILSIALLAAPSAALAKVPWGAVGAASTGASPVCTTFSTDPVCVVTLSTTTASITISGGTAGGFYTLILNQNGTGGYSAVLPTNVTAAASLNGGVIPAIPTAANGYTVWVLEAVGATPTYTLLNAYDNVNLNDVYTNTITTPTTALTTATVLALPTIIVPGVTVASGCLCQGQTQPATWQTGLQLTCLPETSAVQCIEMNPSATTITPSAIVVNVRLTNP